MSSTTAGNLIARLSRHQDDPDGSEKLRAQDFAFGGGKRKDDEIVLVLAGDRLPFGRQNADHTERDVSDADLTSDHVPRRLRTDSGLPFSPARRLLRRNPCPTA